MRRLTGIEWGIMVFAAAFVISGFVMMIHPIDTDVFHHGSYTASNYPEHISRNRMRIYGGLLILLGAGAVWLVFYRRNK